MSGHDDGMMQHHDHCDPQAFGMPQHVVPSAILSPSTWRSKMLEGKSDENKEDGSTSSCRNWDQRVLNT